jgi:hypothetical protein
MTKAVNQHIFKPDSDFVYVILNQRTELLQLVPGPGFIYSGTFFDILDSAASYNYHFRINDTVNETVSRNFSAQPGSVSLSAWWNNDPMNITTFRVNMQYAEQYGLFNPATDSVSLVGTMNNWKGSPKMARIDATLDYVYVDSLLDPGSVQQYKYRINQGDTAANQLELLYQPNRMVRIPDTLLTAASDFNNYNPAKRLMTFQCNMDYFIESHQFTAETDYLDVAGNFNGSGANDILFDPDGDSAYTLQLFLDTTWIQQGPLTFKFRINGNWNTSELAGKPDRTYAFHDTVNQNPNFFACHYNDLDPAIPTPPWAYNVDIQGLLIYKKILSGIYGYTNVNGIPEGISVYRWYRSQNAQGTGAVAIDSANKITYVVDTLDIGKWIVFEVTPKAVSGDSATGKPVRVVSSNSISAWDVGMGEFSGLITRVYPNPATDYILAEAKEEMDRAELINYLNQTVFVQENLQSRRTSLSVGHLHRGIYLLKVTTKSDQASRKSRFSFALYSWASIPKRKTRRERFPTRFIESPATLSRQPSRSPSTVTSLFTVRNSWIRCSRVSPAWPSGFASR